MNPLLTKLKVATLRHNTLRSNVVATMLNVSGMGETVYLAADMDKFTPEYSGEQRAAFLALFANAPELLKVAETLEEISAIEDAALEGAKRGEPYPPEWTAKTALAFELAKSVLSNIRNRNYNNV